jgi:hypothetical protein
MPRRPTSLTRFARSAISLLGGIMVEVVFVLWLILIILGAAALAMMVANLVS